MPKVEKDTLENDLRKLISEIVEIEPEKITGDASFVEDLGMDSMMALEILASVEKKYLIKIPEEYLTKVSSLSALIEITQKFMKEKA
jgi:acyl carrier protein